MKAFVVDAVRTPRGRGKEGGALSHVPPVELLATLVRELQRRHPGEVEDAVLGCSTQTGEQGTNVGRLAMMLGGAERTPASTLGRFCASGIDAIGRAAASVHAGLVGAAYAGGVESMSRVPMFSDGGSWFADPVVAEATGMVHMAVSADLLACASGIPKESLDRYAERSHERAAEAQARGAMRCVVPVGEVHADEGVRRVEPGAFGAIPPSFEELATPEARRRIARFFPGVSLEARHTYRTAPGLADAASLALVVGEGHALADQARARVVAVAHVADPAPLSLAGNVAAVRSVVAKAGWALDEVERFEINESFAAVPLHFLQETGVPDDRLDVMGGALAMGHPLGATGGVLLATLLDALEESGGRRGVASVVGAAGVASALAVERL